MSFVGYEDRLKTACKLSRMFESLLNLVPNNHYFTEDNDDETHQIKDGGKKQEVTVSQQKRQLKFDRYSLESLRPTFTVAESKTIQNKQMRKTAAEKEQIVANNEAVSRNELRARLHAKIEKLQQEKKELKNKKRERNQQETHTETETNTHTHKDINRHSKNSKHPNNTTGAKKDTKKINDKEKNKSQDTKIEDNTTPAGFDFNKIELSKKLGDTPTNILFKSRAGEKKRKLETAITNVKEKRQQLQSLSGAEKKAKETEMAYDRAMQKIEGIKVKSDLSKLKKTQKRHEKKKSKSRVEWDKRMKQLSNDKESRQLKRQENIKKRQQQRKEKK